MIDLAGREDNVTVDAVGPESLTFRKMVMAIRAATGSHAVVVFVPTWAIPPLAGALGAAVRDELLTSDEYHALTADLADSGAASTGVVKLTDWIAAHGDELGRRYANEINRHYH
jgi:hypothetical protein